MYLHDLSGVDKEPPHDHPWDFYSFILKGEYSEQVHPAPFVHLDIGKYRRTWKPLSWHKMEKEWAHRIFYVAPGTKSLIFVGKRTREWGFHVDGQWQPWHEFEEKMT